MPESFELKSEKAVPVFPSGFFFNMIVIFLYNVIFFCRFKLEYGMYTYICSNLLFLTESNGLYIHFQSHHRQ